MRLETFPGSTFSRSYFSLPYMTENFISLDFQQFIGVQESVTVFIHLLFSDI